MFNVCADPSTLTEFFWVICYLTTAKHFAFYVSFLVVLVLLAIAAPLSCCLDLLLQSARGHLTGLFKYFRSAILIWLGVYQM